MTEIQWLTKAQAAAALECDERTVERKARQGQLSSQARPGFPTLYHPDDVARLVQARRTGVSPVILAADPTPPTNGNGAIAHQRGDPAPIEPLLVQVLQALLGAIPQGPTGPTGPTPATTGPTLSDTERAVQWVTLPEAAVIKGRTATYLKRKIADGTLPAEKDRGWRIRRKDLEAL